MTNNWRVKSATHLAILSANRGKFDRRDRGKSQSLHRAHLAIFADRRLIAGYVAGLSWMALGSGA